MTGLLLAAPVLAAKGEGDKAGPIGLAIIVALGIVCYFLFKSMSKHMRRVRDHFPTEDFPTEDAVTPPTAAEPPTTHTVTPHGAPTTPAARDDAGPPRRAD